MKNPELIIEQPQLAIGIEVKCPALTEHVRKRSANAIQLPARSEILRSAAESIRKQHDEITLPRDNPVKDFLISADDKFAPFKRDNPEFFGILVIVWDDFIFEPLSALISDFSGLFTENSFYKDAAGIAIRFDNVDGVVLIRHLQQIYRAARDEALTDDCRHALDYGQESVFPFKVLVQNPNGRIVPDVAQRCLQTCPPSENLGAEYVPQDMIFWLNV